MTGFGSCTCLLASGTNVKHLFTTIIYQCLLQAKVFVPGRPFQPSQMFDGKAIPHLSEAPFMSSTKISFWPWPQILD